MSLVNTYISISLAQYNHSFNHNTVQTEHRKLPHAIMFAAQAHLAFARLLYSLLAAADFVLGCCE